MRSPNDCGHAVIHMKNSLFQKFFLSILLLSLFPFLIASLILIYGYESTFKTALDAIGIGENPSRGETVTSAFQGLRLQIALMIFLLFLLITAGSAVVSHFFARPIHTILSGVKKIADGSLDITIPVASHDELGELATTINAMAQSLKDTREREKMISRAKSEFISISAHQLRTPLSALKWIMNMLLEGDIGPLSEDQTAIIQKGFAANERMINLVNDLLDVARIEEGRFAYNFSTYDIVEVVQESVSEHVTLAGQKNVGLVFSPGTITQRRFKLDKEKMLLALNNLIENAIHYSFPTSEIAVGARQEGEEIIVSVKDAGVGIPKDQQGRIFTKFFRADNVIRLQTEGSGLGLFIVKNVVLRHGGRVWFESEEGRGTTFYIALPLQASRLPASERVFEEFPSGI